MAVAIRQGSDVVIPVLIMDDRAYLLLNQIIPLDERVEMSIDFKRIVDGFNGDDLSIVGKKCRAVFHKISDIKGASAHACLIYPEAKIKVRSLCERFAIIEIGAEINCSFSLESASRQAVEIIKSFGTSFQNSVRKKMILTNALRDIHLLTKKKPDISVGYIGEGIACISFVAFYAIAYLYLFK